MHFLARPVHCLATVLILSSIAFLGVVNIGLAGTQSLNRQPLAKLASATQSRLQTRVIQHQRRHLRQVAKRACAAHRRKLCAAARTELARLDARAARLVKAPTSFKRHTVLAAPVTENGSPSSSGSSNHLFGSSGPSHSSSAKGSSAGNSLPLTAPPSESGSIAESPSSTSTFQPGLNSGSNMTLDVQGASLLGAKLVRIAFEVTTSPAEMEAVVAGYAAQGIRVLPIARFDGTLPTPAQAQSLAAWAATYGPGGSFWAGRADGQLAIQSIELGNETSYGYQYGDNAGDASYRVRAETYALRLREAAEAIAATGIHVGLLAQADDWTGDWMNGMYAAVPNLKQYVGGWVIHPYHHWRSRMEALLEQLSAHRAPASIPIDVTEFGLTADNGNCIGEDEEYNACMSYSEAASILTSTVGEMRQLLGGRLGMLLLYQVRDQRDTDTSTDDEYFYGALQHELQPKGEYTTAVQKLLASS
jgi:hypothetical protein